MTRDEAIKISAEKIQSSEPAMGKWIDAFAALGMLKLDEPKNVMARKVEKACSIGGIKAHDWQKVVHGLELAGLKIVEK